MNEAPPPNGHRKFVLQVVVIALAAVVASELVVILGRGLGCWLKGSVCSAEDWSNAGEMLGSLLATLIALVFALIEGRKP